MAIEDSIEEDLSDDVGGEEDLPLTETEEVEEGLFDHYRIVADPRQGLVRLDRFLNDRVPNVSRTKIQLGIENGLVRVNGQQVKASYKVKPGDVMVLSLPDPPRAGEILPEDIPLNIVYEDDNLLVVNKPAGMVVHPAFGNWTGTLVNALVFHFDQNLARGRDTASVRPGLVHRIDKDTSGLLLIAKDEVSMMRLARQFFVHSIDRVYRALVWGVPSPAEGTINAPLGRSAKDRRVIDVKKEGEGKRAVTHFRVLESFQYASLIECRLETGRTHQIRAHMKHIGHPIFADATYGGDKIVKGQQTGSFKTFVHNTMELCPRQALHAAVLGFEHPHTDKHIRFEAPLPPDMEAAVEKWRKVYGVKSEE